MTDEPEREDIRIVDIVAGPIEDIGAAAAKALPPGRRYRYRHPLTYTLTDGRVVEGEVRGTTKPRLRENLDSQRDYIRKGCMFALFRGDEFVGTCTRVTLSLR